MKRKALRGAKLSICDPSVLWIYGAFIIVTTKSVCWTPYSHVGCHAYVPVSRIVQTSRKTWAKNLIKPPRSFKALTPAQILQSSIANTREIESRLAVTLADLEDNFDIGNGTFADTKHSSGNVITAAVANASSEQVDKFPMSKSISTRRNFFTQSAIAAMALVGIAQTACVQKVAATNTPISSTSSSSNFGRAHVSKVIQDPSVGSELEKIIKENNVNVTIRLENDENTQIYVNRTSFEELKIQGKRKPGTWTPIFRFYHPKPEVVRKFNDRELFFASILAGSVTEVLRSTILYPIATVKTRVQASRFSLAKEAAVDMQESPLATAETMDFDSDESTQIPNAPPINSSSDNALVWYLSIGNSVRTLISSIVTQTRAGNLYVGYLVSLITTVPAAGAFYGVREVTKRGIIQLQSMDISQSSSLISLPAVFQQWNDLSVTLAAALVADIVSLAVRTPAVVFSVRRQASTMATQAQTRDDLDNDKKINSIDGKSLSQTSEDFESEIENFELSHELREEFEYASNKDKSNLNEDIVRKEHYNGDGWVDIWKDFSRQFPTVVLTDLPYLALKITLLRTFATGHESIPEYQVLNILVACVAAFITTPFDVARTVILVDSDRDPTNGLDGGTGGGIIQAMNQIMSEGLKKDSDGEYNLKVQNLFSGWLERVVYFGVAVALLDPLRILGYIGIRDRVLLLDIFQ